LFLDRGGVPKRATYFSESSGPVMQLKAPSSAEVVRTAVGAARCFQLTGIQSVRRCAIKDHQAVRGRFPLRGFAPGGRVFTLLGEMKTGASTALYRSRHFSRKRAAEQG
jgi:hypothetical protein